jgi:hypothetical protein
VIVSNIFVPRFVSRVDGFFRELRFARRLFAGDLAIIEEVLWLTRL